MKEKEKRECLSTPSRKGNGKRPRDRIKRGLKKGKKRLKLAEKRSTGRASRKGGKRKRRMRSHLLLLHSRNGGEEEKEKRNEISSQKKKEVRRAIRAARGGEKGRSARISHDQIGERKGRKKKDLPKRSSKVAQLTEEKDWWVDVIRRKKGQGQENSACPDTNFPMQERKKRARILLHRGERAGRAAKEGKMGAPVFIPPVEKSDRVERRKRRGLHPPRRERKKEKRRGRTPASAVIEACNKGKV